MKAEEAFGKILKNARLAKKLSQEQLAHDSGLDRTFISLLERGLRQPSLTSILQLAEALKITPASLITRTMEQLHEG